MRSELVAIRNSLLITATMHLLGPMPSHTQEDLGAGVKSTVTELIRAVQQEDPYVRKAAIERLGEIGPDAYRAVPVLKRRLLEQNGSREVAAIAATLGSIGPKAVSAAPELLICLDRDWQLKMPPHIQPSLAKLGPDAAPFVHRAIDDLTEADDDYRVSALVGLMRGYGDTYFLPLAAHRSPRVRISVCRALAARPKEMHRVIKLLDDPDARVCAVAAYSMQFFKERAVVAVEKLRTLLASGDVNVQMAAARGLSGIGGPAKDARADLIAVAADEQVSLWASYALAQIGFHEDAIDGYIRALNSPSVTDRYSAAVRLGEFGPRADAAVTALSAALDDPAPNVRANAAEALGKIGGSASVTLEKLEKVAQEKSGIAGEKAIAAIKLLEKSDPSLVVTQCP